MEDPYLEGFIEGRRSMARSIAAKLYGTLPDSDLASLLGLTPEALSSLLAPPNPRPEAAVGAAAVPDGMRPLPGLRLVEPSFVKEIRRARNLTQNELAMILSVHPRTVCEWETADAPVRIRSETYKRLTELAATAPAMGLAPGALQGAPAACPANDTPLLDAMDAPAP